MRLPFIALSIALWSCERPPPPISPGADVIFSSVCARCHGAEGGGGLATDAGPAPRNFHDHAFQADRTDAQLRAVIIAGKNGAMPAFGHSFTDEALDGLVARIRTFDPEAHR